MGLVGSGICVLVLDYTLFVSYNGESLPSGGRRRLSEVIGRLVKGRVMFPRTVCSSETVSSLLGVSCGLIICASSIKYARYRLSLKR